MTLIDFLDTTNLDNSLLIGYYGGGNYGDELLLEVLGNLLAQQGVQDVTVTYQHPGAYSKMHHDFGFGVIDIHSPLAVIKAMLRHKHILIGGGGLWGVDMNFNTLALSVALFVNRWLLGKKVYLLGVGYYNSTTRQGRLAAWFAGKAANQIIARDPESATNFGRVSKHVHQDVDIAWNIRTLNLKPYREEAEALAYRVPVEQKTLLLALRRPQAKIQHNDFMAFNQHVEQLIAANADKPIILAMMESESKDPGLYAQARAWRQRYARLRVIEIPYNPLVLFLYIQKHHDHLAVIAPQLHLIMSACLASVPFLPIAYDNKVSMLLDQIGVPASLRLGIKGASLQVMNRFARAFFGGKP